MPARECTLDNRPNKTSGDLGATALEALTYRVANRLVSIAITTSVKAPHVRILIRANRYAFINPATPIIAEPVRLTIRLSDAGLRRRQTKLIYPNHRPHSLAHRRCDPRSLEPMVSRSQTLRFALAVDLPMAPSINLRQRKWQSDPLQAIRARTRQRPKGGASALTSTVRPAQRRIRDRRFAGGRRKHGKPPRRRRT